jgi:hypothetical protein
MKQEWATEPDLAEFRLAWNAMLDKPEEAQTRFSRLAELGQRAR